MNRRALVEIRDLIQNDVGNRGLRTDPAENLITTCSGDFAAACKSLAKKKKPVVAVLTGFFIPQAQPPCGETDGPLGALYLARALTPLGAEVVLLTDDFCVPALREGLKACGLTDAVPLVTLPPPGAWPRFCALFMHSLTHFIALERVGPSHGIESIRAQPGISPQSIRHFEQLIPRSERDRMRTMRGRDVTSNMAPAHLLVEDLHSLYPATVTIGIGDGGNEIGMGKIRWDIIERNIPNGGLVACRVPTNHLIVAGISNWGAYGLAAGVYRLRDAKPDPGLVDARRERKLLQIMVEGGPLVDGVLGKPSMSVDGLDFDDYSKPLQQLKSLLNLKG